MSDTVSITPVFSTAHAHLCTAFTSASFFSACSTSVESSQKVATESDPADTMVFSSFATARAQICGINNRYQHKLTTRTLVIARR